MELPYRAPGHSNSGGIIDVPTGRVARNAAIIYALEYAMYKPEKLCRKGAA